LEGTNLLTTHPTVKLRPKRYGPFKIIEVIGPTTYRLDLSAQWKVHNAFHGNLLLPYHETKEHGRNFAEPPPELIAGQPEWEVEEILDSRWYWCKIRYLIKWKGYSEAHNSWEPKENVNVPELLVAFHGNNPEAIRMIKKEKEDCAQGTWSYETEERTTSTKPQPHTGGRKVMYLRSTETRSKGPATMTEPGQLPPSYSCTSS
jgi:Chromo (CHRromatin Organisation MOdifier) domain